MYEASNNSGSTDEEESRVLGAINFDDKYTEDTFNLTFQKAWMNANHTGKNSKLQIPEFRKYLRRCKLSGVKLVNSLLNNSAENTESENIKITVSHFRIFRTK